MKKPGIIISIASSLFMIAMLILINYLTTKSEIWWPWAIFGFIWWPAIMIAGKKANTVLFSAISAIIIILYFYLQYSIKTPGIHPWYLYIIPLAVWWPVTIAVGRHRNNFIFLLFSLLVFAAYYGALNYLYSPNYPWIIYPLFVFIWVAIIIYFSHEKKPIMLSIIGAILTAVFFITVNYINSPNVIWAVYPIFAVLWWPLSMIFLANKKKENI